MKELTTNFASELLDITNSSDGSKLFAKFLDQFDDQDFEVIAEIVNTILKYFKLGPSCDLKGEMGSFPTRDEFCQMKLGQTFVKNAMNCHSHENDFDDDDYEPKKGNPHLLNLFWENVLLFFFLLHLA